jgi:hypothetical protein
VWLLKGGSRKGIVTALILTVEAYRDRCSRCKVHDLSVEGSAKAKKTEFWLFNSPTCSLIFLSIPIEFSRIQE